jgi:hypothetical protein
MRMCDARVLDSEKALPQVLQAWGRSPECMRMCLVMSLFVVKALPQVVQA